VVTTAVAVAVIWRYLLHTRYGLVNQGLEAIGVAPSTGSATRAGRCRRSSSSPPGRTSATT
jgi:ABC-type sugar transport system permease subunit